MRSTTFLSAEFQRELKSRTRVRLGCGFSYVRFDWLFHRKHLFKTARFGQFALRATVDDVVVIHGGKP